MALVFNYKEPSSPWAVWASAGWSLVALAILSFGDRVSSTVADLKDGATPVGALGFTAVIFAPCVLLLVSAWLDNPDQQRAIWSAFAWAPALAAFVALFGVRSIRPLIWFSIGRVFWSAYGRAGSGEPGIAPLLTAWIALSLVFGLIVLSSRETPMCWDGSSWTSSTSAIAADCRSDIVDSTEGARALVVVALGLLSTAAMLRFWTQSD